MAPCGQRGRGHDRAQTRGSDQDASTGGALCSNHDHDNRVYVCKQACSQLDRGALLAARFLAGNATRFRDDSTREDRSRRSGSLAESRCRSPRAQHPARAGQRPAVAAIGKKVSAVPIFCDRWTAIGVLRENIHVVGSIKYDPEDIHVDLTVPEKVLAECKIDNHRPIILGGSTHAGEEEILGKIFRELRREFASLFLIIAPRHAERAREIHRAYQELGLHVVLRSRLSTANPPIDCLVLDSTGELRNWYTVATVVFIGKSLTARGGQNPAEAIVAGKPVVFGQHMENFAAFARALVERGAALQISSADELKRTVADLLGDAGLRQRLAENAREVLDTHGGASARTAALIVDSAPTRSPISSSDRRYT